MRPIVHTLVCGASRSGKSEAELSRLVPLAKSGEAAIVLLDPPGTLAQKFLLHLDLLGLTGRVVYDRLEETERVPGYEWLAPSSANDPLRREAEDDESVREFAAVLLRRRGILDPAATPLIEEGLLSALRLYMKQKSPVPLTWLSEAFTVGSDVRRKLLANCVEPSLVRKFEEYGRLSATARRTETAPAERVLRAVLESPAFRTRSGGMAFDLDRFLDARGVLILDGGSTGSLSRDAAAVMMGAVILRVIRHCRRGSKSPVVLVLDEAVSGGLLGLYESRALSEAGKWGLQFDVLVQDPFGMLGDEVRSNVLQNCGRHEWFRQGSPEAARLAADDLAIPLLDPLRVHHTEYRVRTVDAGYERVPTVSRSETVSADRHVSRTTTWATGLWPRRRDVREAQDRFLALRDQVMLLQRELTRLPPGHRFVRDEGVTPAPEYVRMLTDPWSEGARDSPAAAAKFRFVVAAACRRSPYRRPQTEQRNDDRACRPGGASWVLAQRSSPPPARSPERP